MDDIRQAIEAASNRWMQAWVDRDETVLKDSLADDFVLIMSAGPVDRLGRADWLSTACSRYFASEFHYRDVQVKDLGSGTVVMSSIAEFKAEVDGMPRNGPLFLVDFWRKQPDGQWRVSARYSSCPEPASRSAAAVGSIGKD